VTGVDPAVHEEFVSVARAGGATSAKPYDVHDTFHEVMVLLGFLSACTSLDFITGVLVLPQRQTALAAKQAAEVDVLSGGRLRLGVGVGWNRIEFRSMGYDFSMRGRRLDAQIDLLRRYWMETPVSTGTGDDWAEGVGIAPRPVQQPIPIWVGAGPTRRALERVGRTGNGWLPVGVDPTALSEQLDVVRAAAREAGRDPGAIGIQGRLEQAAARSVDEVSSELESWRRLGATHVAVNTMRCGLEGADAHVEALRRISAALNA
jgi:probable F420-dependent oxidoreductase